MPKKKASAECWSRLPDRVFISHSYADVAAADALLKRLPKGVSPVVWPRVDPEPRAAVSDGIVQAIRECRGLIWLRGGESERTFWVPFERDYARRSGLQVFSYDPASGALWADTGSPLPLRVEVLVSENGLQRAEALLSWMKSERSFEFQVLPRLVRLKELAGLVARLIHEQRVAVWLMDGHIGAAAKFALELPPEDLCRAYCRIPGASNVRDTADFEDYAAWLDRHSMHVRLTPEWQPLAARDPKAWEDPETRHFVLTEFPIEWAHHRHCTRGNRPRRSDQGDGSWFLDLVSAADPQGFDWNRADDLIVQLTCLLRNSEPFFADEEDED